MPQYDVQKADYGSTKLRELLDAFWEPFHVTSEENGWIVWLRKARP